MRHITYRRLCWIFAFVLLAVVPSVIATAQETPTTCTPAQPVGWVTYAIQPNDTLSSLALRTGSTVEELQSINCIEEGLIVVGTSIFVPREPDPRPESEDLLARCRELGLTITRCREIVFGTYDDLLRRCVAAGFTEQECRRILGDNTDPTNNFARRCLNAGYTEQQCRRIWNALNDDNNLLERCRNAGLTTEQCRRIWNANNDDEPNIPYERCRNAGLTEEQCRRIFSDDDGGSIDRLQRCLNAGISEERCRALFGGDDGSGGDANVPFERCRALGITDEQCRRIFGDNSNGMNDMLRRCLDAGVAEQTCRRLFGAVGGADNPPPPPDPTPVDNGGRNTGDTPPNTGPGR